MNVPTYNSPAELPLVSLVITAYNQAGYLDQAIQSVLDQNYPNLELIVLDDGSTDHTCEVLEKYNGIILWESHANRGQAATLNKGWHMSRGEILSYLSSDDYLLPGAVTMAVRHLQELSEVVQVYCDFLLVDSQSRVVSTKIAPAYDFEQMVAENVCMPGPGVFFRRWAYEKSGGWDSSFRQMPDYEFWIRLGLQGKFFKIPQVLAAYRIHDESQSIAVADPAKADEPPRAIEKLYQQQGIPEGLLRVRNKARANALVVSARLHIRSGRFATGGARFLAALVVCPAIGCSPRALRIIANALRCGVVRKLHQIFS